MLAISPAASRCLSAGRLRFAGLLGDYRIERADGAAAAELTLDARGPVTLDAPLG